ncbi:hypothetical protein Ae505Ps2_3416c [Pseudonocardia sp. Ae505_Ps2]|nr:hypothetical protein Ae505Ps2_3416c [Pseudonocardia sp. Ae505_Ps2]
MCPRRADCSPCSVITAAEPHGSGGFRRRRLRGDG